MADKKPANREKLNEITASIERGIKELFQSDRYAAYLRTMPGFTAIRPKMSFSSIRSGLTLPLWPVSTPGRTNFSAM